MTYDQILDLLNRGMTPADIQALSQIPAPAPAPEATPAPAPEATPALAPEATTAPAPDPTPAPAPEWAQQLNDSIRLMTNALHANAIMQEQQPPVHTVTADEALASIIAPPKPEKVRK